MKCQNKKQNEVQCGANAMLGIKYCFSHNPETHSERRAAILKGGRAPKPRRGAKRLESLPLRSIANIQTLIEDTINRVRTEPITHQKANCIGYLANIALKALEVGGLEERISSLEEKINNQIK